MEGKPTLLIGDVHGHYDRLSFLLAEQKIIDPQTEERTNFDVEVIQLGDLGHFGGAAGSPTGDKLCYEKASNWFNKIVWGNHDAAVFNARHRFMGYVEPDPKVKRLMQDLIDEGKLVMSHSSHGYLFTHAGLHKFFGTYFPFHAKDPKVFSNWVNQTHESNPKGPNCGIWDAIGGRRGGRNDAGGILWRDASEKLYDGFPQVFGHSRGDKIRKYGTGKEWPGKGYHWSYCVDLGTKQNGRLGGIWLPDEQQAEVKVPAPRSINEPYLKN
jgi:hypothetical protein